MVCTDEEMHRIFPVSSMSFFFFFFFFFAVVAALGWRGDRQGKKEDLEGNYSVDDL